MSYGMSMGQQNIFERVPGLMEVLLQDHSTGENIRWACSDYEYLGDEFKKDQEIKEFLITGQYKDVVRPRIMKTTDAVSERVRGKAEVFTPLWVCNRQNNLIDAAWFGCEGVFNQETHNGWITITEKIAFPGGRHRTWEHYVDARRMEITCGEGPYLTSRYDPVSGTEVPLPDRIGLLDRKFRVISENAADSDEWTKWAVRAVQATYGYDAQGDNVLLARENLLYDFCENYEAFIGESPDKKLIRTVANIISWNIWQMDGITMTAPFSSVPGVGYQYNLFEDPGDRDKVEVPCKIKDWRSKITCRYKELAGGQKDGR